MDAQLTLEELRKSRNRVLAALAVTIGSDTGAAHVLGLPERDVRTARKSVNREEALDLATNVLDLAAEAASVQAYAPRSAPVEPCEPQETQAQAPTPAQEPRAVPERASPDPAESLTATIPTPVVAPAAAPVRETVAVSAPASAAAPKPAPGPVAAPAPAPAAASAAPHVQVAAPAAVPHTVAWTVPMDQLLVQGWHEGVNPSVLATQLGCDLTALALRVQELSYAESAPAQAAAAAAQADVRTGGDSWEPAQAPSRQPGRHRRHRADGSPHGLFPQETLSQHPPYAQQGQPEDYHLPYGDVHAYPVGM
ncbi:hypothetical protein ABZV77_24120 [Streptomyces sp. NPDC004732]|uniref:hypothetical protein n=1 Tax=Streptomyces sp. NPDC004732 TaxID=3154290 RepID=UPI0033BE154D